MFVRLGDDGTDVWVNLNKVTHFAAEPPLVDGTELTSIYFENAKPLLMAMPAHDVARVLRRTNPGAPAD